MKNLKIIGFVGFLGILYNILAYADIVRSPFRTKEITIGLSSTAANNVKLHRGASGLQTVPGNDSALDGVDSSSATVGFLSGGAAATPNVQVGSTTGVGIWTPTTNVLSLGISSAEKMRIHSNGFIGMIDETAPGRQLHITDADADIGIKFTNSGTSGESYSLLTTNTSSGSGAGKFILYNDSDSTNQLIIDASGGTYDFGNTTNTGGKTLKLTSNIANRPRIEVSSGGSNQAYFDVGGSADFGTESNIALNLNRNGNIRFQVAADDSVSIWNDASIASATIAVCMVSSTTDALQPMRTCTSSLKYKKDIEDIPSEISSQIYNLKPRKFAWKVDGHEDYGLIAEEVNEYLPLLVPKSHGEPETVNYRHMVSLLIAEMKRLKDRIEVLESEHLIREDEYGDY